MSSKLVCISGKIQFACLDPDEGYYIDNMHYSLLYLYDNVEISGQVGAHPVVASPPSVAGNLPLCRLGFQQPQRKDHEGFTKNDAQYVQAQISSSCDESLESHRLLELEVTIYGMTTIFLIDNSSTSNFVDRYTLDNLGLQETVGKTLEIVLADGSRNMVDKVCHIPVQFYK